MKLGLKHLAPYLPYGLKIQGLTHGEIAEMSAVNENNVNINGRDFTYGWWADIFDIKPILRPLSDLTKEIEHDGNTFTPMTRFAELDGDAYFYHIGFLNDMNRNWAYIIGKFPHWFVYKYIIKWHFDVFGLIDAGLAIDINTLNK